MENKPMNTGRAHVEAERIILERIYSGEFPEGMRLPATAELASQLNLGTNSVHRALGRLSTLGYLERKPRVGTIVRRRKTQEANVIVLVGPNLKDMRHYMDRRLTMCIEEELKKVGFFPYVHDNLISMLEQDEAGRYPVVSKLIRDFTLHDPVGVIESTMTFKRILELTSEFERPTVSIKSPMIGGEISIDTDAFLEESIKYLEVLGKKRLLWVLKVPGKLQNSILFECFWRNIKASSLECVSIIEVNDLDTHHDPEVVVCERMKRFIKKNRGLPPAKRVDCVLVNEDILMRGVSVALLSEQVRIPDELILLSHTNEAINLHYGVPVIRYETPTSKVAEHAVKLLKTRILKEKEPDLPILVKGQIEDPITISQIPLAL